MPKLIFGCGYLGRRVATRWLAAGHEVYVVTRSTEHAREFSQAGLRSVVADVTRPASLVNLPAADTVLFAVGYDRTAGVSIDAVYVNGFQAALDALPAETGRVIYISSTGVYGSGAGDWIDEDSPCEPQRAAGRACLAAEQRLSAHNLGSRGIVLRLAGIYGPGRIPRRDDLLAGRPIAAPSAGYLNLIHVDDAASVVLAAEERATPPRTYLVSDGQPAVRGEYYRELARLLGAPAPQFTAPPSDSPAAQRAAADKRISNKRLMQDLGVRLEHPSYLEGLAAIVAGEQGSSGRQ